MQSAARDGACIPLILAPASCQYRNPAPNAFNAELPCLIAGTAAVAGSAPEHVVSMACLAPAQGVFRVLAADSLLVKMSPSSRRYDSTGSEYMEHAPCISQIATLLADPKRSAMMWALMDGSAGRPRSLRYWQGCRRRRPARIWHGWPLADC